jgi:hypothetical protein
LPDFAIHLAAHSFHVFFAAFAPLTFSAAAFSAALLAYSAFTLSDGVKAAADMLCDPLRFYMASSSRKNQVFALWVGTWRG